MVVLGSTQPEDLARGLDVRRGDIELVRRRSGGGAVYLEPGAQIWMDAWIPSDDPLWLADVSAAAGWVGEWWNETLAGLGQGALEVHRGRAEPGEFGELVCFAGRGPGEVFLGGRKLVGLSQWRAREGALFSSCAYLRWNAVPLLDLVHADVDDDRRASMRRDLPRVALGLGELDPPLEDLGPVREQLLRSFPAFETASPSRGGGSGAE